jgi:hypothetical protein
VLQVLKEDLLGSRAAGWFGWCGHEVYTEDLSLRSGNGGKSIGVGSTKRDPGHL